MTQAAGLGRKLLRSTRARDSSPATWRNGSNPKDNDSEASAYRFLRKRQLHRPRRSRYWVVVCQSAPVASGDGESYTAVSRGFVTLEALQDRGGIRETSSRLAVDDVLGIASLSLCLGHGNKR